MVCFRAYLSIFIFLLGAFNTDCFAQTFSDVTSEQGIVAASLGVYGSGMSFYDWNGDGFDELTLLKRSAPARFFQNNAGTYEEVFFPELSFLSDCKSINWVDINNDGAPDITFNSYMGNLRMFLNNGDFTFTDITVTSGILQDNIYGFGQCWSDYNKDGFPDLYVSNYMDSFQQNPHTNLLFRNNGDGTFADVSDFSGVGNGYQLTLQSVWMDYNNDSWPDLLVLNDRADYRNYLYHNNGNGTFTERGIEAGIGIFMDAMSASVADYNNDGWFDIYITNTPTGGNVLFKNNGNGTFSNVSAVSNIQMFQFSWGAVWLDADNDHCQDLFVATIPYLPNNYPGYNYFFRNIQGTMDPQFSTGLSSIAGSSFSAARGDINNDGLPDLVSHNFAPLGTGIWKNTSPPKNYLKVKLQGVVSNRDGIGCRLTLHSGNQTQYRYTMSGEQYLSQNSQWQFFGLGNDAIVDSLVINWPLGHRDVFYQIPVNQNISVLEGSSIINQIAFTGNVSFCEGDSLILDAGDWSSYSWSNNSNQRFLTVKESGLYSVNVSNGTFVIPAAAVQVIVYPKPQILSSLIHPKCNGEASGSIALENIGPAAIAQITWNDGFSGLDHAQLESGTYHYQLSDIHGCMMQDSFQLEEPALLQLIATFSQDSCPGFWSGELSAFGGTPPYQYTWDFFTTSDQALLFSSNDSAFSCLSASQNIQAEFAITDGQGCVVSGAQDLGIILSSKTIDVSRFRAYPNPVSNLLTIVGDDVPKQIFIHDASGRFVYSTSHSAEQITTIDLSHLDAGFYLLSVQDADRIGFQLIIKH